MVIGYLVSGIGGGLAAAAIAVTFADPGLLVAVVYVTSGFLAMAGFGLYAHLQAVRH